MRVHLFSQEPNWASRQISNVSSFNYKSVDYQSLNP